MDIIKGNLLLLIASFIWGTAFIAQASGMYYVGPLTFTFVRFLMGALTIFPLIYFFEKKIFFKLITNKKTLIIIICTSISLGLGATVQQYALLYTEVSNAAFITALYVPMVPLILRIILKKEIHFSIWIAVIVCLFGLYLLTAEPKSETASFYDILLIFAALCFAIQIILTDIYTKSNQAPFTFAFSQYFLIFAVSFVFAIFLEKPTLVNIRLEFFEIFYAGALSVGVAYTLQIIGQKKTSPAPAAIILSMETVFAAIFAWILISQSMSLTKILGCFLIFLGIIIAQLFPLLKKNNRRQ